MSGGRETVLSFIPPAIFLSIELFFWGLNIEALVTTMSILNSLTLVRRFLVIIFLVIFGNAYSYWFWGYLRKNNHSQKSILIINFFANRLPPIGFKMVKSLEAYVTGVFQKVMNFKQPKCNKMFIPGVIPVPTSRVICSVYCGHNYWLQGMIMLCLGDITKTTIEIFFMHGIFQWLRYGWHLLANAI